MTHSGYDNPSTDRPEDALWATLRSRRPDVDLVLLRAGAPPDLRAVAAVATDRDRGGRPR